MGTSAGDTHIDFDHDFDPSNPPLDGLADPTATAEQPETPAETSLMLTGERTVPGIAEENYWFRRHEAAYKFLLPQVTDMRVVEVGCGEGYGSAMLANVARAVVALDYDPIAVRHAAQHYPAPKFAQGNLAALPLGNGSADVVVSLQVVEHVWDHAQYVRECARVLRCEGTLIVSTPNRLTFSPGAGGTTPPTNPFHTHEFTGTELVGLLASSGLAQIRTYGLFAGESLTRLDRHYEGSFIDAQLSVPPSKWDDELRLDVANVGVDDFVIREATGADLDMSLDLFAFANR